MNNTMVETWIYATLTGFMVAMGLAALVLHQEGQTPAVIDAVVMVAVAGVCLFCISVIYRVLGL